MVETKDIEIDKAFVSKAEKPGIEKSKGENIKAEEITIKNKKLPNKKLETWERMAEEIACENYPIFETHAHYNLKKFSGYLEELLGLLRKAGVDRIIIPAIDYETNSQMITMFGKKRYGDIYFAFGSHPKYIWKELWDQEKRLEYESFLSHKKCVAVGEAGLDYSYIAPEFDKMDEHLEKQRAMFEFFIQMANKHRLPMILHIRPGEYLDVNSAAQEVLCKNRPENGAVLHCFGGSVQDVQNYMELGVTHFGLGGRVCYGDPILEAAIRCMPESAILLETDAPYVKPEENDFPNTSLSIPAIAEKIAAIRGTNARHILEVSYRNAVSLFPKCGQ